MAFLRILFAPKSQLTRIRSEPQIWGPVVFGCLVGVAGMIVTFGGKLPTRQLGPLFWVVFALLMILAPAYAILVGALVCWVACKITKAPATYEEVFSMNAHVCVVFSAGHFVATLFSRWLSPDPLTTFLDTTDSASVMARMASSPFVLVDIWCAIVLGMGLRITARAPRWVAYAVPSMFLVANAALWLLPYRHA